MKIIIVLILFYLLFSPLHIMANELDERESIRKYVASFFMQERFEMLDAIAEDFKKNCSRTASGIWKLSIYRTGIGTVAISENKDEAYWENIEQKALKWVNQNPDSPFAHNAYALILVQHGWKHRGKGWARDVKPENWEPFYYYINKAKEYLIQNKEIGSKDPNWYEAMLRIATAESWDEKDFNQLIDEALSKNPLFYELYFHAVNFLTPKWHGSRDKIEKFAKEAVNRTKDKEGKGLYARIYWYASQAQYGNRLFKKSKVIWSQMSEGIDDVLAEYPDQWNINNFAHFACLAGDKKKANELLNMIEGEPIIEVWRHKGVYEHYKNWASGNI